jgi:CHAD domain-containing protein
LGKALACLARPGHPDAVHEVRKELKKLRAIFRLSRGGLSRGEYEKAAEVMRLAAKPLAVWRDARVTRRALDTLAGSKARQFPKLRAALRVSCEQAGRRFKELDYGAITKLLLEEVGERLDDAKLKRVGWAEVRKCLEKTYAQGRDAYLLAMRLPTPEHLHGWRKRAKDLWYQLDFLCPAWPARTKALLASLKKLGNELGADHDLVLLQNFAREQRGPGEEAQALDRLIEAQRQIYDTHARQLGSQLYQQMPEAVCTQVEQDWKAWCSAAPVAVGC